MEFSPPPPLPVPCSWGLPPPDPRIGLNGLVLKRRTGWKPDPRIGLNGLVLKRRTGWKPDPRFGLNGLVLKRRTG
ncbi:hypothetical protein [Streptomyces sp. NPDC058466]|uniref:hypothetical protein n=1 Tax=Streptomyces sp. NPDC058466 TaxID=3346512 RepID=UPI00365F2049